MVRVLQIMLAVVFLTVLVGDAREGYLRTRTGAVFEGHLRFESNIVVVVNVAELARTEVALTNLAELVFFAGDAQEPLTGQPPVDLVVGGLPSPWLNEDIGFVGVPGEATRRRGVWRLRSAATNVLGAADAGHFVWKAAGERSELLARVSVPRRGEPWARAGLMIRESLMPGARHVFASVSAARGGVMTWRDRYADEALISLDGALASGGWLKLKRDGNQFTALKSRNGMRWAVIDRWTMNMSKDCYVGLVVTGSSRGLPIEALFEGVEEGLSVRNRWFTPQVEMPGGSIRVGQIESMDDGFIYFESRFGREPLSRAAVAQIRFQPLTSRGARELNLGRRGVLLATGEFIDGECRAIEQNRLILNSVPLGLVRYDLNSEVVVMLMGDRRPASGAGGCVVRQTDGSVWRGRDLTLAPLAVRIRDASLGWQRLPLHTIAELRMD